MEELIWINRQVMPLSSARVGVEDRGFQFADGVYEYMRLYPAAGGGVPFALEMHLDRLWRSCGGIRLTLSIERDALAEQIDLLAARSGLSDGMIYLQATRGESRRNHAIPKDIEPTLLFYTRALPPVALPGEAPGTVLLSVPDERWKRCWIKAIALLPNVLAKTAATDAGADEAVFVDDAGFVSECTTSNLFAVIDGVVVTHPNGNKILPGVTRAVVLEVARDLGIEVDERAMSESEALSADEVFITSTTREIAWVNKWNDVPFGNVCGPVTLALHRAFQQRVAADVRGEVREVARV